MEILEGRQCVLSALLARQRKFQLLLIKQGMHQHKIEDILSAAATQAVPVKYVSKDDIDALTKGRSHGGIAAICSPKAPTDIDTVTELCKRSATPPLLLLIEGTEDTQNLGYTLRTAEAFGVHAVLLKKHVWNFESAAVSRASSGAFERLPLVKVENAEQELASLQRLGIKFLGCIGNDKRTIFEVDLTGPALLAIGGERRGLSGALRQMCEVFVRIPMQSGPGWPRGIINIQRGWPGSLSLTQAACAVMTEAMRQRLAANQVDSV